MKLTTQKKPFCGDFHIIKGIHLASFSSISRIFVVSLLIFSSTLSLHSNAFAIEEIDQQVPAKKVTSTFAKSTSSTKIVKSKKDGKRKKSVVIKKDTLKDIDPASSSSPLYNN